MEAPVPRADINQDLTLQELHLPRLKAKKTSSESGTQHGLGLAPLAVPRGYFQRPCRLQSFLTAGAQHPGSASRAGLTAVLIQHEHHPQGLSPLWSVPLWPLWAEISPSLCLFAATSSLLTEGPRYTSFAVNWAEGHQSCSTCGKKPLAGLGYWLGLDLS